MSSRRSPTVGAARSPCRRSLQAGTGQPERSPARVGLRSAPVGSGRRTRRRRRTSSWLATKNALSPSGRRPAAGGRRRSGPAPPASTGGSAGGAPGLASREFYHPGHGALDRVAGRHDGARRTRGGPAGRGARLQDRVRTSPREAADGARRAARPSPPRRGGAHRRAADPGPVAAAPSTARTTPSARPVAAAATARRAGLDQREAEARITLSLALFQAGRARAALEEIERAEAVATGHTALAGVGPARHPARAAGPAGGGAGPLQRARWPATFPTRTGCRC